MLKLKPTAKNARFLYADGTMEVSWLVSASLEGDELVEMLRRIVGFYDAQQGPPALPERLPGMALGMAQTAHPAPVGNGWAATAGVVAVAPELPARLQGEVEFIPPEEQ